MSLSTKTSAPRTLCLSLSRDCLLHGRSTPCLRLSFILESIYGGGEHVRKLGMPSLYSQFNDFLGDIL
jgi:hypothetical protein